MGLIRAISKIHFLPKDKLLQYYPPFFLMGVKVRRVGSDGRELEVTLPLRWYSKNTHGTMFGGFITAVADPLPAIMCGEILKGVEVWSKSQFVDFLKPGRTKLHATVKISEHDLKEIEKNLQAEAKTTHTFEFYFKDSAGANVAHVKNTVYFKRRALGSKKRDPQGS